jgi:hypothetical protein
MTCTSEIGLFYRIHLFDIPTRKTTPFRAFAMREIHLLFAGSKKRAKFADETEEKRAFLVAQV